VIRGSGKEGFGHGTVFLYGGKQDSPTPPPCSFKVHLSSSLFNFPTSTHSTPPIPVYAMPPKQSQYAENLSGTSMGLALYEPIPYREEMHFGCTGDVAYFDSSGDYKWVCNAFSSEVFFPRTYGLTFGVAFIAMEFAIVWSCRAFSRHDRSRPTLPNICRW
jgi:hypothetical protein